MEAILIASVCHEANRAYCLAIGDTSQEPWTGAPEWQRQSAIEGVEKAQAGEDGAALHESWCALKVRDGWVYGPEKNAEAKTHHCLVPYAELPAEQQRKDALFGAIVKALG